MAINNQYSQTPKRVYSNKPFLAGMNYTNADLQPNVCRAVANLEMESSNTATKTRQGATNRIIEYGNSADSNYYILRFYTKLVMFKNTISEEEYNNDIIPEHVGGSGLGLVVTTYESGIETKINEDIISNINSIEYDSVNDQITYDNGSYVIEITDYTAIFALKNDEGFIPYAVNSNDFSFTFFGIITENNAIAYKGLIKLYNHAAANKIIIEYYKPTITDVYDVQNYGSNLIANNPLLYRDYVYIDNNHNYYTDYMGNQSKDVIDVTTIQVYDTELDNPITKETNTTISSYATANIVKGINCDTAAATDNIYLRPYYVIPKGDYSAVVRVSKITGNKILSSDGLTYNDEVVQYFYNNNTGVFDKGVLIEPDADSVIITAANNTYSDIYGEHKDLDNNPQFFEVSPVIFSLTNIESDFVNAVLNITEMNFMTPFIGTAVPGSWINQETGVNSFDSNSVYYVKWCTYFKIPTQNIDLKSLFDFKISHAGANNAVNVNCVVNKTAYVYIFDSSKQFITVMPSGLSALNITINLYAYYENNAIKIYLRYFDSNGVNKYLFDKFQMKDTTDLNSIKYYTFSANSIHQDADVSSTLSYYAKLDLLTNSNLYNNSLTSSETTRNFSIQSSELTVNINLNIKNNTYAILNNYVTDVQYISNGSIIRNYSIPIKQQAFRDLDLNSTTITVILFKKNVFANNYYTYSNEDSVIATTSVIQLRSSSILYHQDALEQTTLFSKANNLGMHLGYYIVYGKYAGYKSLYYSMFNDCSYFPSMYKIDFDNDIVHVHQHLGNLIVFTTDDVYMLFNGSVPATVSTDGAEVPFTKALIQANVRLGYANVNTVRSIGKDVFFISSDNEGYLLKSNKYVNNSSDVYLIKVTNQIADLLESPYNYAKDRYKCYYPNNSITNPIYKVFAYREDCVWDESGDPDFDGKPIITINEANISNIEVYDGDTFRYNNVVYRLGSLDCPELTTDRLGATAGAYVKHILSRSNVKYVFIYDSGVQDTFERHIAYVYIYILKTALFDSYYMYSLNGQLLKMGLAKLDFYDYTNGLIFNDYKLYPVLAEASAYAKKYKLGLYNTIEYEEPTYTLNGYNTIFHISEGINNYFPKWGTSFVGYNYNVNSLYVYTTNSYINIIQSILLSATQGMTIIYKYNIDNRTWISYDLPFALFPTDVATDTSKTGYMMCCSNDYKHIAYRASKLTFSKSFKDVTDIDMNSNPYKLSKPLERDINVYFDSGNQSISLLYDKLFREIKISLGALPDDKLSTDYIVNFYVDGISTPVRPHYSGRQDEAEGFKKITFLTPARGRIPRFTFSANCKSSINILEYALIYLQLNAK